MSDKEQAKQFVIDNWKLWSHQSIEYSARVDRLTDAVGNLLMSESAAGFAAGAAAQRERDAAICKEREQNITIMPAWLTTVNIYRHRADEARICAAAIRAAPLAALDAPTDDISHAGIALTKGGGEG